VVRIPTSALVFRERGMEVAIVGPGDRIEIKPITIGRNLGTEVEVLTGLALSERLVNSPPDSLSTGDLVRVAGSHTGYSAPASAEQVANPGGEDVTVAPESKQQQH